MKNRYIALFCSVLLLGTTNLSTFAYAQTHDIYRQVISENAPETHKDIIYYVHSYLNNVRMHRLWNATQGYYIGLWEICDCK